MFLMMVRLIKKISIRECEITIGNSYEKWKGILRLNLNFEFEIIMATLEIF